AGHPESVSEHPEQRGGGIGVDTTGLAVDIESDHALLPLDGGRLAGRGSDYDARCPMEVKDFGGPAISPGTRAAFDWRTRPHPAGRGRRRRRGRTFRRREERRPPPAWPG